MLQNLTGNPRTGFCIGQCMMVVIQLIAADGSHRMQLVILQSLHGSAGHAQGIIELIVRIIHLVHAKDCFQTAFIKRAVVGHQWQTFYQRCYLFPHLRKYRSIICIPTGQSMHLRTPVVVIVRFGIDEGVKGVNYLVVSYNDHTYRTDGRPFAVSGLKVYGGKIFYGLFGV